MFNVFQFVSLEIYQQKKNKKWFFAAGEENGGKKFNLNQFPRADDSESPGQHSSRVDS